jgi:hypothetical protein
VTDLEKALAVVLGFIAQVVMALVIVAAVADDASLTNAGHGVDPLVPSTCWP